MAHVLPRAPQRLLRAGFSRGHTESIPDKNAARDSRRAAPDTSIRPPRAGVHRRVPAVLVPCERGTRTGKPEHPQRAAGTRTRRRPEDGKPTRPRARHPRRPRGHPTLKEGGMCQAPQRRQGSKAGRGYRRRTGSADWNQSATRSADWNKSATRSADWNKSATGWTR